MVECHAWVCSKDHYSGMCLKGWEVKIVNYIPVEQSGKTVWTRVKETNLMEPRQHTSLRGNTGWKPPSQLHIVCCRKLWGLSCASAIAPVYRSLIYTPRALSCHLPRTRGETCINSGIGLDCSSSPVVSSGREADGTEVAYTLSVGLYFIAGRERRKETQIKKRI